MIHTVGTFEKRIRTARLRPFSLTTVGMTEVKVGKSTTEDKGLLSRIYSETPPFWAPLTGAPWGVTGRSGSRAHPPAIPGASSERSQPLSGRLTC